MKPAAIVLLAIALCGCERTFRDMYDQPRYKPLAASPLWSDGRASRDAVAGAVPHSAGTFAGTSSGRLDLAAPAPVVSPLAALRDDLRPETSSIEEPAFAMPAVTDELLARGRDRFDVFCSPCHGIVGDGDGFIARRGFPHPPSYHTDRLRAASDAHLYAVISEGYGAMYPYSTRIAPPDRFAVVAYIRALQLSQHAPLDAVPTADRAALEATR